MRTAITLQRLHGATDFQVVTGPEVSVQVQKDAAKAFAREHGRTHPEIAEVQVWTSSEGLRKRYKFSLPTETVTDEEDKDDNEQEGEGGESQQTGEQPEQKTSKPKGARKKADKSKA